MSVFDEHFAWVRQAVEATTIDELLSISLDSTTSIPASRCAAVIAPGGGNEAKVTHHRYLSNALAGAVFYHSELIKFGRQGSPPKYYDREDATTAEFLNLTESCDLACILPLKFKGTFFGILVFGLYSADIRDGHIEFPFTFELTALCIARLLSLSNVMPNLPKSQLEAKLTDRQMHVINCVVRGMSNSDIASKLHLSLGTVKAELGQIFKKLDVSSRTEVYLPKTNISLIEID